MLGMPSPKQLKNLEENIRPFKPIDVKLRYWRADCLPKLPGLLATALLGCAFCKMLREDLISSLASRGVDDMAKLTITHVKYSFEATRLLNDVFGLKTLHVHFAVGSKYAQKHSLRYGISTDECGKG